MNPEIVSDIARLVEEISIAKRPEPLSPRLRLALELFGLSRFTRAPRLHLLTLISAVEAVAQPELLPSVNRLVDGWLGSLPDQFRDDDSLKGRLRGLKKESIGGACRRTVGATLSRQKASEFNDLYQVRSKILHEGTIDGIDLAGEAARAEDLVAQLLEAMISSQGLTIKD